MMNNIIGEYDVLIVGGGVVGTALLYTLSKYTDIKKIGLIEKYNDFGLVNSASHNNSQTLHFGDIETNYTIEKATSVKRMADMVMKYLESRKDFQAEVKSSSASTRKWYLLSGNFRLTDSKKDILFSRIFSQI